MYKEACRIPFPSRALLNCSWYVSQQRVHYQAFLKHMFIVLDITLNNSYQLNFAEVRKLSLSKGFFIDI